MPEDNITNGGIFLPTGWHQTTFDLSKLRDGFFEWRDVLLVGLLTWLEFHKRASTWVHFKSAPLGTKKQKPSSQFTSTCVSLSQTCHNWDLLWLQNSNLKNQQIWHKLSQEVRNTHTFGNVAVPASSPQISAWSVLAYVPRSSYVKRSLQTYQNHCTFD